MKGAFLGIVILFLLGCVLSFLLILSREDYALMLLKGKKYSEAALYYQNQYAKGSRATSVMVPLNTLEVANGDNDRAIRIMEQFVREHPTDIHALELLGNLYLNSVMRPQYLVTLEKIKALDPNKKVMEELLGWYHALGEKKKEEALLWELMQKGYASPKNYTELAYLLADQRQYEAAFNILQEKVSTFPKLIDVDTVTFQIALLIKLAQLSNEPQKNDQKMITISREFLLHAKKSGDVLELISAFEDQKRSDLAYSLIPFFGEFAEKNSQLQTEAILLESEHGDKKRAYVQLLKVYARHQLTPQLAELLTSIVIDNHYYLLLYDLLDHINPTILSESTLLWLALTSEEAEDLALLSKVEKKVGSSYLYSHPIVHVAFLLAHQDPKGEKMLRHLLGSHAVPPSQALLLMRLAANNGDTDLVLEMGASLIYFKQMSEDDLIYWAMVYVDLKKSQEAIEILSKNQKEIESVKLKPVLALLNTATGNTKEARKWLSEQKEIKKTLLIDFYHVAEKAKDYPFALEIAIKLREKYPDNEAALLYAMALLNNGNCHEALEQFRKLEKGTYAKRQVDIGYLTTLIECKGKEDEETEAFLNHLLSSRLNDSQLRDIGYLILEKLQDLDRAEKVFSTLAKHSPMKYSDLATLIAIMQEQGEQEKAYILLIEFYRAHSLDASLTELLANMALQRGHYLFLEDLLNHSIPQALPDSFFLSLALEAYEKDEAASLVTKLQKMLGKRFFHKHPSVDAAFMISQHNSEGNKLLQELVRRGEIRKENALVLTQLAAVSEDRALASEMGRRLFSLPEMSREEIEEWAMIFIRIDRASESVALIKESLNKISPDKWGGAMALLDAALGNLEAAHSWYVKQKHLKKTFLTNFYFLVSKVKAYPFALQIATRLYRSYPNAMTQLYYATALSDQGFCHEAVSEFRQLIKTGTLKQEVEVGYVKALIACKDSYYEELHLFLDHLINTKQTIQELRDIASLVLEKLHDYKKAERFFLKLVRSATPNLNDFETLLSLFGPRPPEWLIELSFEAAQQAKSKDKIKWVQLFQNFHAYDAAYQLFQEISKVSWTSKEYLIWLSLLHELKDKKALKIALRQAFFYLNKTQDLQTVLSYTSELEMPDLQRQIHLYFVAQQPCDALAWQGLGKIEFEVGNLTGAFDAFNHYFSFACFDKDYYLIQFLYGEMLLARNDPLLAEDYYYASLEYLDSQLCLPPAMRSIKAVLYDRVHYKWLALRELMALYYENPNPAARAAWGNLLIAMGRLKAAHYVLYDLYDTGAIKKAAFTLEWKEPIQFTTSSSECQLLIETSLPISESNLQKVLANLPQGVKSMETGYHRILVITESHADFRVQIQDSQTTACSALEVCMNIYPEPPAFSLPLAFARVNLAMAERNNTYAAYLLKFLLMRYPENLDVLQYIANLEAIVGKWQCATGWFVKAHRFAPLNESIWGSYRDTYFPYSKYIGFEEEGMYTRKTAAEFFYRLRGEWILSRNAHQFTYAHVQAEVVRAHISEMLNQVGLIEGFLGNRERGFVKIRTENYLGTELMGAGYLGSGAVGAGAHWLTRFDQGNFSIYADWNRPYWDILECLVHFGTQDRAGVAGHYIYNARLDGFLDLGVHQYGEKRARHAVKTAIVQGFANYFIKLTDPFIYFNYNVDAEYVLSIKEKITPFGEPYAPVPLDTRENHTIRLMFRTQWHRYWSAGGYYGETYNRYGTNSWTAGLFCDYAYPCGLEINVSLEHFPSTTVAGASVNDFKAGCKWRF